MVWLWDAYLLMEYLSMRLNQAKASKDSPERPVGQRETGWMALIETKS
jgi:hypothetical protein